MARGEAWRAVGPNGKEVKTEGVGKESAPPGPGKAAAETKKQFWTGSVDLSAANSEMTLQEVVVALEKAAGEGQLRMAYRSGGALAFSVRSAQAMTNLSKGGLDVGKTHLEIFDGVAGGSATRARLFGIPLVATEAQIREGLSVLGKVERVRLECYPGSQILNGMAVAWVHLREPSAQHPATVRIGGIPTAVKVDKAPPAESAKTKVVPEQSAPRPAPVPATPAPAPAEQQQQQPGPTPASKPAPAPKPEPAASKPAPAPSVPAAEGAASRRAEPVSTQPPAKVAVAATNTPSPDKIAASRAATNRVDVTSADWDPRKDPAYAAFRGACTPQIFQTWVWLVTSLQTASDAIAPPGWSAAEEAEFQAFMHFRENGDVNPPAEMVKAVKAKEKGKAGAASAASSGPASATRSATAAAASSGLKKGFFNTTS